MHSLLRRQLRRHLGSADDIPDQWRAFIDAVDAAYRDADTDRGFMERSMELASSELLGKNRELRGQAEELARSNAELEQFAYITSHDLRAPLRAIDNLSQWIEDDLGDQLSENVARNLGLLRGRVQRMKEFISALLQYSRVGTRDEQVAVVDVGRLVDDIVAGLDVPEAMTVEVSGDLPVLRTARTPLWEILLNLIENAIKHHDRSDGRISVRHVDLGDMYEFAVRDDGPGIDPQFHDRIFEIFQTLRSRDEVESTGMGLALVKKLVDRSGGRLRLQSREGQGASFFFTWPKHWHMDQGR